MKTVRALLLAACALLCAQTAHADLAMAVAMEALPGSNVSEHGGVSTWRLTIRNTGDVPIEVPAAGTDFVETGSGKTLSVYAVGDTAPCEIHYTDFYLPESQQVIVNASIFWHPRPLAPGASADCIIGITIDESAPNFFVQNFAFSSATGMSVVNDVIAIPFLLGPLRIPIPSSSLFGMLLLIGVLVATGVLRMVKK